MEQMTIELRRSVAWSAAVEARTHWSRGSSSGSSAGDPGHPRAASDGGPSQQRSADGSAASAPSGRAGAEEDIVLLQVERKEIKGAMIGAGSAARSRSGLDLLPIYSGPAYHNFPT